MQRFLTYEQAEQIASQSDPWAPAYERVIDKLLLVIMSDQRATLMTPHERLPLPPSMGEEDLDDMPSPGY